MFRFITFLASGTILALETTSFTRQTGVIGGIGGRLAFTGIILQVELIFTLDASIFIGAGRAAYRACLAYFIPFKIPRIANAY